MATLITPHIVAVTPDFRPGTHTLKASFGLFAQYAGREPVEIEQNCMVDIMRDHPNKLARFCREYGMLNNVNKILSR